MTEYGFKQTEIQEAINKPTVDLQTIDKGGKKIIDYLSNRVSKDDLDGKIFQPRTLHFRKKLAEALIHNGMKKKNVYRKLRLEKVLKSKKVKKTIRKLSKKQRKLIKK